MRISSHNSLPRSGGGAIRPRGNQSFYLYNRSLESLNGRGVPKDPEKSFRLTAQAAEAGMRDAVLAMGWFYLNGVGVERNNEQAKRWYRKSARQGEPKAMFSLGQMAYDEQNHKDALVWFSRAADKGHARSLFWVGKLYWRGHGVPTDRKQAMRLFQRAAGEKVPAARRVLKFLSRNTPRSKHPIKNRNK
jgi:TPR repeat protein